MKVSLHRNTLHLPVDLHSRTQYREAVRLFLLDCRLRNLSPFTIQSYHGYLQALQHDLESWRLTLSSLQSLDLSERMIQQMLRCGFAANTINGRIRTCQQFFKFLFYEGIIDRNLASGLKPIRAERAMPHTFCGQQPQAILGQPDQTTFNGQRDYTMMLILLDTGMRVSELSTLKVPDVNTDERHLLIHSGKNRKARRIPFQQTCGEALRLYLALRGSKPFDDVWVTKFQKPFIRCGIIDMISRYCKKAGIGGVRGSSHTFRRTMAKLFLLQGGNVETLQYMLGHSSLEMTKYYVDLFPMDLHQQHQKYSPLENLFANTELEVQD